MIKNIFLAGIFGLLGFSGIAQCSSFPVLNLGNDLTLCQGATVNFTVPAGYDYFSWNIVSGNPSTVTISSPTTVILTVQNTTTTNLVVNGDFEAGNTGFTTQYVPGMGGPWGILSNEGTYAIATNPNSVHSNFSNCSDVTATGPGNMLIINGSTTPNTEVWAETITVDPNTNYNFSAWVTSVANISFNDLANLQFFINGAQVGPIFSPTLNGCDWQQFFQIWNSGAATSANISIVAQAITGNNDFALDDISFIPVCAQVDTVVVNYDPNTINAGPDVAFCEESPQTLTATANFANPNFTWETGATTVTITPTTSGYYTVTATSTSGCFLSDSALVNITAMPWDFDLVESQPTSCGVNNGVVYVTTSGTFNDPPYYTWNGPGANNPNQIDASVWQNLSSGWYYIEIESDGCYRYDSAFVDISNPPVANVNGNPLTGTAPLTVDFTNTSTNGETYVWNFGNGNMVNATDLSPQQQIYDTPGTYQVMLINNQGNCSDTDYVTVIVQVPPIPPIPPIIVPVDLSAPNVFTPNGDKANDFFEFDILNIKELHIDIMNRWGEVVFSSDKPDFQWDGTSSGTEVTNGVYTYTYTAKGAQDEKFEGQGFVQVFR